MIAAMKRLILLLIFTMFALSWVPSVPMRASAAEERYAYVPDGDVWFYAAETESSRVFLLPKTYYVKLLGEGEMYCRVEYLTDEPPYQKVTGFCRTEDIIPVTYLPSRPYLKKQITLSYSLPSGSNSLGGSFSSIDKTFVYYGQRYDGAKLYYYVLSDGTFDYISAESEVVFDLNTDYSEYLASVEAAAGDGGQTAAPPAESTDAALIVVICIACVAAIAVAVFLVRGKKAPPPDDQGEE